MNRTRALPGFRLLLAVAALIVVGLCAGAAVPGSASADDDDDGDNGGGTYQICSGDTTGSGTTAGVTTQICTIEPIEGQPTAEDTATCYQRSDEQIVIQRCEFEQTSATSNLRLTATQIHDPEGGPNGTQDGTQVIQGTQTNTSSITGRKSNYLKATQLANQCLGHGDPFEDDDGDWNDDDDDGDRDDDGRCENGDEEDGDDEEDDEDDNRLRLLLLLPTSMPALTEQSQEAHQTIDALQSTVGNGKNEAYAFQTQHLHERAANATTIDQQQNTEDRDNECGEVSSPALADPLFAHSCFSIKQQSATGVKIAKLEQDYQLFQSARNATGGFQEQGPPINTHGGLHHSFDQATGTGTAIQDSDQIEHLRQRRHDAEFMPYDQNAAPRKDVGLQSGVNSRADMLQDVVVSSIGTGDTFNVGNQDVFMEINCSSPGGNCKGTQRAETNDPDASYFDMDSGTGITMLATCETFEGEGSFAECTDELED